MVYFDELDKMKFVETTSVLAYRRVVFWTVIILTSDIFVTGSDADDMIGPEGMEKFCEDIGVEPENVSMSPSSGHFTWNSYADIGKIPNLSQNY